MLPSSERLRNLEDWVGQELSGKWRLDELLGVGGMAAVYGATERTGKRVAVKLLHAYYADDEEVRRRFLREGYAANRVKHPAVISAQADGVAEGGLPFLVLELIAGCPLDRVMDEERTLTPRRVLHIADQVLDALIAAHAEGVVHRDLKPDNLIVDELDTVCVVDFGIAYLDDTGPGPRMTMQGCAMGTPAYMAPEQARGDWDAVGETTDLWSLGATMFALLTGRDVFIGTPNAVLVATVTRAAPPVRQIAPDVPPAVAAIVDRALAFEPAGRWQSARAMQLAVREVLASEPASNNVPTLVPVAGPRPARRRHDGWQPAAVAAAGALTIALAGSGDYLAARFAGVAQAETGIAAAAAAITEGARAWGSGRAAPCDSASDRSGPERASCRPSPDGSPPPCPARDSSPPR